MKKIFAVVAAATILTAAYSSAATVTFGTQKTHPSSAATADGAPANGDIYMFTVTTDADILSVNQVQVQVDKPLFQVPAPFGSDTAKPDPAFIAIKPSLEADSYIDTPGSTSLLGTGLPGDGTGTWGDLSNDGAQTNFKFSQLTFATGAKGTFTGRVSVAGASGPEVFPFSFQIGVPEPTTLGMASLSLLGLVAASRRKA
jgi:hypothetical protein